MCRSKEVTGICRVAVLFMFAVVALPRMANAQAPSTAGPLVILVRHAEKASAPAADPSLTPEGAERAKALEAALASSGVTAIITTEFKRTIETAAPLAQKLGITPEVVRAQGTATGAHVQAVVSAVQKHSGGVVLVVGHSNTVPAIIAALGAERMRDICDPDYDNLFVVMQAAGERKLIKSRFGAADKAELGAASCTPMR